MDWLNPVEWAAWLYGKVFQNHAVAGGFLVVTVFAAVGVLVWIKGVDKYKEEHQTKQTTEGEGLSSPKHQAAADRNEPPTAAKQQPQVSAAAPRKLQRKSKEISTPRTITTGSITQGAGSIAQIGGQNNSATVSNIGTIQRNLTAIQKEMLASFYESLPRPLYVRVYASLGDEAVQFGGRIANALTSRRFEALSWRQSLSPNSMRYKGLYIMVHPGQLHSIQPVCAGLISSGLSVDCYEDESQPENLVTFYVGAAD